MVFYFSFFTSENLALIFSLPGDEHKTNGGSVEALKEHLYDSSKVNEMIPYFRSFCAVNLSPLLA